MRNCSVFGFTAVVCAAALLGGCGGDKGADSAGSKGGDKAAAGKGGGEAAAAAGLGTPKPPFEGELPKGALKVEDIEIGRYGGRLVLASPGDGPKSFNPIAANETSTTEITHGPLFGACWEFDNKKQVDEPGLCEKYEAAPDGLTYTFTLREGVRWSDGTPLTADDVAFNYEMVVDPKTATSLKDLFRQGKDAEGNEQFATFEKVDARTFRFKLVNPDPLFHFYVGSMRWVPKHKWEKAYKEGNINSVMNLSVDPKELVTSGPFRLKKFVPAERIVLERNPYYWKTDKDGNRLPYLDGVIFVIVPDFNVAMVKFREGETDLHAVRPEDYDLLKREAGKGGYQIADLGPSFNTNYFMFNQNPESNKDGAPYVDPVRGAWFRNKTFRKAVSHAIDRESIVRTVFYGRATVLWAFTSPANKLWHPGDAITKYPYDLKKAEEMLKADGFAKKDDGLLYDKAGNKVEFKMATNAENSTRISILNVIKDDLKKLGITAHVTPVPFNELVEMMRSGFNWEAILLGWASGVPPDPAMSKNVFLSSGRSHVWYPNQKKPATEWEAKIDELAHKATSVLDPVERKKYSTELYKIFADELPQIMLAVSNAYVGVRDRVGNAKPAPLRPQTHWNIDELFIKAGK